MRKSLLMFLAFVTSTTPAFTQGIVHKLGSSSEDSLSVVVLSLDSLGRPTTADSFFVLVLKSDANGLVFRDSGTTSMVGLDTITLAGQRYYYYHRAVADIDSVGAVGAYAGVITAKKINGNLLTPNRFSFQIVDREMSDAFDSAGIAATNSLKALDSLKKIIDSVYAILDTLQDGTGGPTVNLGSVSGDIAAADNFETMLDGSGGQVLTLGRLVVQGANGASGSVTVANSNGTAVLLQSLGGNGHGLLSSGNGSGSGFNIVGGASGYDINADIKGGIVDSVRLSRTDLYDIASKTADSVLKDSSHYQGNCSSSTGSGAYSYNIAVMDSSCGQVVIGADLAIRNLNQTSLVATGRSITDGRASFNLDAATYLAIVDAPGYIFPPFDTITVSGPGVDTVYGYRFDPGSPASPSLCRVYGFVYDVHGVPQVHATVSAFLPNGAVRAGQLLISPVAVTSTTDSMGYFALDLIPSDSLNPSNAKYEITILGSDGALLRQRIRVPTVSSWRLDW
ncbi:MAG TPA: hypothetical protein VMS71_07480 [Candidatus Acidoferrum sp.]|nr:hypothetical protein [Candidatus Acidoferrum sp.]